MRLIVSIILLMLSVVVMAQTSPPPVTSGTPVAVVATTPATTSFLSAGFVALIVSIVACLNIALSAVQQGFSALSKTEPGWLQTISKLVLGIAKYVGSNPNV